MSTSLKSEVGQQRPNAPHIPREALPGPTTAAWRPGPERVLIRIPDLSDSNGEPPGSRKVQRLIDILKVLRNRPRSMAAGGVVLAGALLVAVLVLREPSSVEELGDAPAFDAIATAPRRLAAPEISLPDPAVNVQMPGPQVLAEVPASPAAGSAAGPALLGPSLGGQPAELDQIAMPGVARLLGEIVPDTIEEAKHESSGPGLH
jgi:hypothetical protein